MARRKKDQPARVPVVGRLWDARVTCEHCVALGTVSCPECGLTGVPLWDDDGASYTVPNHSAPHGDRCHAGYVTVTVGA